MLGHSSLQMIFTKYYSWIPKKTRNDGAAFMKAYSSTEGEREIPSDEESNLKTILEMWPKCAPLMRKGSHQNDVSP
jgi:hypothetical protein